MGENPEVGSNIAHPPKDYLSPFAHKTYPFITCNPDGILIFPDGSLCLFEAKTATHHKKDDWMQEIPGYYVPQPRQYLEVLDDPRMAGGYIGCCFGAHDNDWVMHKYERDWILGKKQIEIEAKFWQDYIAAGVLPPLSGNAELDLAVVYGYSNAPSVQNGYVMAHTASTLPADCEALFEEYMQLEGKRKTLSTAKTTAYNEEMNIKTIIATQVPEGLTVIKQPDEVSYRVSFKKSAVERVQIMDLQRAAPEKARYCTAFATAMEDEKLQFSNPKVSFAKTVAKKSKKGASA